MTRPLTEGEAWRAIAEELLTTGSLGKCWCGTHSARGLCIVVGRWQRAGLISSAIEYDMGSRIDSYLNGQSFAYNTPSVTARAMAALWLAEEAEHGVAP